MRIAGKWLTNPHTQAVCKVLTQAGHRALFVGGCVRNALLDTDVNDIDLSTDALPDKVMELARSVGMKAIPTGIDHGTVTIVAGHIPYEITTFRRDIETTGRHAVVAFTDRVDEDARRRDFTMNALYAEPDGTLVDPLGGIDDLKAGRVRFIEDADARIREDYLRILRFFRFHAWYGNPNGGLDPEGLAACASNSAGLDTLSKERIGAEMLKLLSAANPAPAVASMVSTGCLMQVLPGSNAKALPIVVHLEETLAEPPSGVRRLASLGGEDVSGHFRLSNAVSKNLDDIRTSALGGSNSAEVAYRYNRQTGLDAAIVRAALLESPLSETLLADLEKGATAKFPVAARDLLDQFQGRQLGAKLQKLESEWIASGFTLTRQQLLSQSN